MRRLFFILLACLVVAPAAFARRGRGRRRRPRAATAVVRHRRDRNGAQPAKGALWGQMDKARSRVYDPVAGDGEVLVSGYEKKPASPDYRCRRPTRARTSLPGHRRQVQARAQGQRDRPDRRRRRARRSSTGDPLGRRSGRLRARQRQVDPVPLPRPRDASVRRPAGAAGATSEPVDVSSADPDHPGRRGRELDRLVRLALPEERRLRRPHGRDRRRRARAGRAGDRRR